MKLPKEQTGDIITELLKMLGPAVESGTELMPMSGNTLISNGVKRDAKGALIIGGGRYLYPVAKLVNVDHALKIAQIIDQAKDLDQMTEKLGEYLAKYAISKAAVIDYKKGPR